MYYHEKLVLHRLQVKKTQSSRLNPSSPRLVKNLNKINRYKKMNNLMASQRKIMLIYKNVYQLIKTAKAPAQRSF